MEDSLLLFRNGATAGNLTATETGAFLDFGNVQPHAPITVQLIVPAFGGTTPTLQVDIEESDDGATASGRVHKFPLIDATGKVGIPYELTLAFKSRWARAKFTVTGTTPNFGAVHCAPVLGGLYDRY